jgi:hypothetical protein
MIVRQAGLEHESITPLTDAIIGPDPETVHTNLYCNGFDQTIARQQLCKHVQTCNNGGMPSLLSSDSVNILAATNVGNNTEYII